MEYVTFMSNRLLNWQKKKKNWIAEYPVITSTNEGGWAQLDFNQSGQARGFSVDYLNLVAEKIGIKIDYKSGYTWSQTLEKLKNKEIDMAQSIILHRNVPRISISQGLI